jgi:hypothetical protein
MNEPVDPWRVPTHPSDPWVVNEDGSIVITDPSRVTIWGAGGPKRADDVMVTKYNLKRIAVGHSGSSDDSNAFSCAGCSQLTALREVEKAAREVAEYYGIDWEGSDFYLAWKRQKDALAALDRVREEESPGKSAILQKNAGGPQPDLGGKSG